MADSYDEQQTDLAVSEKDEVKKWRKRLSAREDARDDVAAKYRWQRYVNEFKGDWSIVDGNVEADIPPLNLVFAYIKTEMPSLYVRDPHIKVNPKNESSIASARIMEQVINYLWRTKKIKREIKKCLWDGKLVGHSWLKTGYTGKFGTVEDGNGNTLETILEEDFFAYRSPYDCVVFDGDAVDPPFDCSWVAFKVYRPLEQVKANAAYRYTDKLQAFSKAKTSGKKNKKGSYGNSEYESDGALTCLYEVWDKVGQKVLIIGDGVDEGFLAVQEWPYQMKGFPVSHLCFNPVNDEPYGVPDVHMFERQILEKTKLRAMMLEHVKSFSRQFLAKKGLFDDETKEAYRDSVVGQVLEVNGDPKNDIAPLPYASLQLDIYPLEDRITDDLINISGQTPSERGGSDRTTTRTIREILEKKEGAKNRRSEQVDVVEDFIEDIASNLGALVQQFADIPYYVRVTGKLEEEVVGALQSRPSLQRPGAITSPSGFTYTKEDIQGEFDYEVVTGSTIPLDKTNTIGNIVTLLESGPKLGLLPGGPVMSVLLSEFAEAQDMPVLQMAVREELKMQKEIRSAQKDQQDMMMEADLRREATDQQLEAEKIRVKEEDSIRKSVVALNKPAPSSPDKEKGEKKDNGKKKPN